MKTLIAVPCMDEVAAGFAGSLAILNKPEGTQFAMNSGSLVYDSRNRLVKQAIAIDADYLLFLDSDMVFDPDLCERLLARMQEGRDIVTGIYFRRAAPYTPVLFKKCEVIGPDETDIEDYVDYPKDSIFEIQGCGGGALMISKKVLIDMALNDHTWFDPFAHMGEDLSFCVRARRLGYTIWCDSSIKLGHIGKLIVTEAMFESIKGGLKNGEDRNDHNLHKQQGTF